LVGNVDNQEKHSCLDLLGYFVSFFKESQMLTKTISMNEIDLLAFDVYFPIANHVMPLLENDSFMCKYQETFFIKEQLPRECHVI